MWAKIIPKPKSRQIYLKISTPVNLEGTMYKFNIDYSRF